MQTRIEGRDGWIEVSRDGISVLAKGDDALAARLDAAIAAADGDDLADVVTDELTSGGVRRTPDFALVDHSTRRVLVRGTAAVQVNGAEDATRVVLAPTRGPWADEDIEGDIQELVLVTGEADPEPETPVETPAETPVAATAESAVDEPAESAVEEPAVEDQAEPLGSPAAPVTSAAPTGWAMPTVFTAASETAPDAAPEAATEVPAEAPTEQQPIEEAEVIETPAPSGQDLVADEPAQDEDLPSFDFLFGNTNHHRSSLMSAAADADAQAAPIDSGPVAAAGGFQAASNPADATLAPPSEYDEDPGEAEPSGPTVDAMSAGLPPMPGSAPFAETEDEPPAEPTAVGADAADQEPVVQDDASDDVDRTDAELPASPRADGGHAGPRVSAPRAPSFVQAARDDSTGHEPGGGRPQFADGHLVGSRVPQAPTQAAAAPADSGPAPTSSDQSAQPGGVISEVPWGGHVPGSGPTPGLPGLPFGLPGLPTPDVGAAQPVQASPAQESPMQAGDEVESGPMVLSVRCSLGHQSAAHATRCRVCGQDLPSQQPEQTLRPALGQLRLSTGDVVTLDRGVLIGRAPRAAATSGSRSPHLVRISSPDNEISRNHVEIILDGWHVLVRDLGSTNGTTVALPGSSPVRVRPGDQQTIEPGSTITVADQISMVFEVTE